MTRSRLILASLVSFLLSLSSPAERGPNILIILADDMGYGDLGRTGTAHLKTPHRDTLEAMFKRLGEWEATLPTVPLWGSTPFWSGQSAKIYDTFDPRPEPK